MKSIPIRASTTGSTIPVSAALNQPRSDRARQRPTAQGGSHAGQQQPRGEHGGDDLTGAGVADEQLLGNLGQARAQASCAM